MIKEQRKQFDHLLVLDAGDSLVRDQSPALSTEGKSSVELMNMMAYDAATLGEGDLGALSLEAVRERMREADFSFLSANAFDAKSGKLLAEPYIIREVGTRRVAIVGITGAAQIPGIEIRDPLSATQEIVEQVRPRADILILLSHAGLETNRQIAREIPGIDVIISGLGQEYTPSPYVGEGGPPIVHADVATPGHAGRRMGVGIWSFDDQNQLAKYHWQSLALGPQIADDAVMYLWVEENR